MIGYLNGHYIPEEQISISPHDRGFLFGDGAYEVIRSYNGKLFRPDLHLIRMARSLRELRIDGSEINDLLLITKKLIEVNDLGVDEAVVYIQITRGSAPRKHAFPAGSVPPTIFARAWPYNPPREKNKQGVKIILAPDIRWARCDIKSINLLPNVLAKQQANDNESFESVFVRDGAVTEGSSTNVCAVFDGTLVTHPKSHYILAGITREVVLGLCDNLKIPVKEIPVLEHEILQADELMIVNTTSEVMPVVRVNDSLIGNGKPGPVTMKLQRAFRELTM